MVSNGKNNLKSVCCLGRTLGSWLLQRSFDFLGLMGPPVVAWGMGMMELESKGSRGKKTEDLIPASLGNRLVGIFSVKRSRRAQGRLATDPTTILANLHGLVRLK